MPLNFSSVGVGGMLTAVVPGPLVVGPRSVPIVIPKACRLASVAAGLTSSPLAGQVVADIHLDGTSIFTNQGNRPTIQANTNASGITVPDVQNVQAGDVMTIDIDEVGVVTPEFIASPSVVGASGTATITRPAEAVTGDLILLALRTSYVASAPITVTPHAGFTEIGSRFDNATGSISLHRYWKFDTGEATLTFTTPGNNFAGGRVAWIRNALAATPIDATAVGSVALGTTFTVPSITPAEAHELLFASVTAA